MSWAEVKKLNSDLSTPLNILATIQHIDMVGTNYVGYGDIKGTVEILASDSLYNHMIAKTVLGGVVASQNDVALAVAENDSALQKILVDVDIKTDMGTAIKDYNDVALAVVVNDMAFKKCLGDSEMWTLTSQNSIITAHCETKLSASAGVGEWLAFLADSDNTTLKACADMTAVAASSTAMTEVASSETAMTAVAASSTAMTAVAASSTAMTAVAASSAAINAISTSINACSAIRNSTTAITALDNSSPISIPTMTSFTAPSGVVSSNPVGATGYEAWKAFDKNSATSYAMASRVATIDYEFTTAVWCYKVTLIGMNNAAQMVSTGSIQYYNGSSWVDALILPTYTQDLNIKTFAVAYPSGKIKKWRLNATNTFSADLALGELNFYCK